MKIIEIGELSLGANNNGPSMIIISIKSVKIANIGIANLGIVTFDKDELLY